MLVFICALSVQSMAGQANKPLMDKPDINRLWQMSGDSAANRAIFDRNIIARISSQLENEKMNSERLKQAIHEKDKLLVAEKVKRKQTHETYLSALGLLTLILISLSFWYRKTINRNSADLETNQKQEFELKLAKEKVRVRLETLEAERERISRNLHDGISNNLVSIRLHLHLLEDNQAVKETLNNLVEDTHREIRAIMHNLSSPSLSTVTFERLFRNHIDMMNFRKDTHVEGLLLPEVGWNDLNERTKTDLYRLLQEITGNIVKHAQASRVTITLRRDEECIILLAEDDGVGLQIGKSSFGFGMRNLKARIEYLNGDLQVNSLPQDGTVVRIQIPLSSYSSPNQVSK